MDREKIKKVIIHEVKYYIWDCPKCGCENNNDIEIFKKVGCKYCGEIFEVEEIEK